MTSLNPVYHPLLMGAGVLTWYVVLLERGSTGAGGMDSSLSSALISCVNITKIIFWTTVYFQILHLNHVGNNSTYPMYP